MYSWPLINRTAVTGTATISSVESVSNVDVGVSDRNFPLCVCVHKDFCGLTLKARRGKRSASFSSLTCSDVVVLQQSRRFVVGSAFLFCNLLFFLCPQGSSIFLRCTYLSWSLPLQGQPAPQWIASPTSPGAPPTSLAGLTPPLPSHPVQISSRRLPCRLNLLHSYCFNNRLCLCLQAPRT